jgi:DNA-binding MarR family transcriptional regulator
LNRNINSDEGPSAEDAVVEFRELLREIFTSLRQAIGVHQLAPLKRSFDEAGLRERHARLMVTLAETGPVTIGELAARMRLASATTSLLAGELDRAGFLERREDQQDRRRTIVSLPEHLQAPLAQFASARVEPLRRTLDALEPRARAHFLQGLRVLADQAKAAAQAREQDSP